MPSMYEKWGLERAAADAASEEGKEWADLSAAEKEKYYNRVRLQTSPTKRKNDENGNVSAESMFRRMGR